MDTTIELRVPRQVVNDGWSFVPLTEEELAAADEDTAIRGYKIEKKAQKVIDN